MFKVGDVVLNNSTKSMYRGRIGTVVELKGDWAVYVKYPDEKVLGIHYFDLVSKVYTKPLPDDLFNI